MLSVVLLPLLWIAVAGQSNTLHSLQQGYLIEAAKGLSTVTIRDSLIATGTTSICGSLLYQYLDLQLFFFRVPFVGFLDQLLAKLCVLMGLVLIILGLKM
jgi:hypothetical protein